MCIRDSLIARYNFRGDENVINCTYSNVSQYEASVVCPATTYTSVYTYEYIYSSFGQVVLQQQQQYWMLTWL